MAAKKRRNLARDMLILSRVFDRIAQAQELLYEARNMLGDDRLKMPQLIPLRLQLQHALDGADRAGEPFEAAFDDGKEGPLPEFSKEYLAMTEASYKGGAGETD